MAGAAGRFVFKLISTAIALPIGRAATKLTTRAWAAARPNRPPVNPREVDTNWKEAVIWAGLTGVGAAVARLLTTKGADTVWRAITGRPSPRPKQPKPVRSARAPKASKKAESGKAAERSRRAAKSAGVQAAKAATAVTAAKAADRLEPRSA